MPARDDPGATIPLNRPQKAQPETTIVFKKPPVPVQGGGAAGGANPDAPLPLVFGPEIARGGMGSILEALDCKLGRTVAVKIILSEIDADESQKQRFIHEAAVLGQLAHPNIVPVHDIGRDKEGQLYYSMKLVKGRTLQAILKDLRQTLPEALSHYTLDRLLTIFRKVCDAMAFAHSRGIIHRDLKPENIMVGEFGEVLVMDWGLAKHLNDGFGIPNAATGERNGAGRTTELVPKSGPSTLIPQLSATLDGSVMGTPQYMSPEQAEGRVNEMDARSDIFSLGGILYAILTLHPPVEGKTLEEVLKKVTSGEIVPPAVFSATTGKGDPGAKGDVPEATLIKPLPHCPSGRVPDALSAVAMKALSVDKAKRYQEVDALQRDIEAYQNGFATSAENAGVITQIKLLIQRHKGIFSTAAAAWLIITALAVWFVINVTHAKKQAENERDRAERTLTELHGTAPTFVAQANALVEAGKPEEALGKIGYAIQLDPKNPIYRLQRAHLLEAGQNLPGAAAAYREVLALDPANRSAKGNLALCERLHKENGGASQLSRELQGQLVDELLREGRAVEAGPLAAQLGKDSAAVETTLRARLKEYSAQPGWRNDRIQRLPDTTFKVDLQKLKLNDLSILQGMPISFLILSDTEFKELHQVAGLPLTYLAIANTHVMDLSFLRGFKLENLVCGGCRIGDIAPLSGMPLRKLLIYDTQISDLSVLAGMPLEELNLRRLHLKSLKPLRGLPLRQLDLNEAKGELDLSNLADCRELEEIIIPTEAANIQSLRGLPKLVRLRVPGYQSTFLPPEKFWAEFKPEMKMPGDLRFALRRAGINLPGNGWINLLQDGTLDVNLNTSPVANLEVLRSFPISVLGIINTKVRDLAPLCGMPLRHLNLNGTEVANLDPLRGMPLTQLHLRGAPVDSVAPLRDCPTLEIVTVPRGVRDVEVLRELPKLRLLSYESDNLTRLPDKTAEQFWREYDAAKAAQKQ